MVLRYFARKMTRDKRLFSRQRVTAHRRRMSVETLESRAMLASNTLSLNASWTSNGQTGSLSGTIAVDRDGAFVNALSLNRVGGNLSTTSYEFDSITSQGKPTGTSYSFTTAARGSYELRLAWSIPTGTLATYSGGTVSSFSLTSPSQGIFISGGSGVIADVNDAPFDIALSRSSIQENTESNAAVGILSSWDPDVSDTHTYSLVSGPGSNGNAYFSISGTELRATSSFDFELANSYEIRVRSTDVDGLFTEKTFTISVTNVNEAPLAVVLSNQVCPENQPAGTAVGSFAISDQDSANTFTYSLVSGSGSADNNAFTVVGNELRTAVAFD